MILNSILTKTYARIRGTAEEKFYYYKLALLLFIFACLFSGPNIFLFFLQDNLPVFWETVLIKSNDLTSNLTRIEPHSHLTKIVFRLTMPLLIKLLKLPPFIIVFFQIIIGCLIFLFSYKLVLRCSKDVIQSTLFASSVAFIYPGMASLIEYQFTWIYGFFYSNGNAEQKFLAIYIV